MTGKRNRDRTADAPVFSHFLTAAGREKAFRRNAQPQNEILCSKGLGESPTSSARSRMAILGHCLPRCPALWDNPRTSEAWGICQGLF